MPCAICAPILLVVVCFQLLLDLVIMGTLARSGLKGIVIGNTAESVLGALNCPVLRVKPIGFVC